MGVVEMKEFRLTAFAQKNNDVVCDFPNIFFVQNFSNPPSRTSISRKKKAQTQMGNDSQSKKKVSGQKTKPRQRF